MPRSLVTRLVDWRFSADASQSDNNYFPFSEIKQAWTPWKSYFLPGSTRGNEQSIQTSACIPPTSLLVFFSFFNPPVRSHVFCTPFFPHCGANPTRTRPPGCDAPLFLIFLNVPQTRERGHMLDTHSIRRCTIGRLLRGRERTRVRGRSLASYWVHIGTPPLSRAVDLRAPNRLRRDKNTLVRTPAISRRRSTLLSLTSAIPHSPAQRRSAPAAKLVFAT